ncbi:ABC transporter permease [Haloferax sp. MBLA0076]|uniref:ABC transporter permease n=1 Tax=Haloferax litoreum TaxID=2666140 RepID=A0A6A8GJJ3_9EURY|nr:MULTISPECIES: ABC transporter permease [Haloferax]KAB1190392.1 ABC transporter permease [Haloferax sp. CBA1148]MRX23363.1 ABC transporter permease [Haloferax litoreum]
MSVRSMVPWDARLQFRYGFYAVYAIVTVLFGLGLAQIPESVRTATLVMVLFADPGFLGFYFVGALVLFEKNEGVLHALVTSPLSARDYLVSKAVSLAFIAVLGATTIAVFVHGLDFSPVWFLLGLSLTAVLFALVGFVAVAKFDSLNAYFLTAILYTIPLSLPLLDHFGIVEHPAFYVFPTQASLVLISAAFEATATWKLAYGVGYLLVSVAVAYVAARRAFLTHIVRGTRRPTTKTRQKSGILSGRDFGPIASLAVADLRKWVRDPLLIYIGVSPFLIGLLVRVGIDPLDAAVGFVDFAAYSDELLAALMFTPAGTLGFAAGFFMLEDREQGILQALRATPLTGRGYLLYRGVVFLGLAFLSTLVMVPLVDIGTLPLVSFLAISFVASLHTAVAGLLMASLAANTVEGVAVSKLLGFLIIGPVAAIALVGEPFQFVAGVLPPFWAAKAAIAVLDGTGGEWFYLAVGLAYQAVVVGALLRVFLRRAD